MQNATFQVREHGGIDPTVEEAGFVAKHLSAYVFAQKLGGNRVLEVGCGDGYGADLLASEDPGRQVTAVDLFETNVRSASARYKRPNLRFSAQDATALTLPDGSFDLVVSFQVIEHVPEARLPDYLRQIRRVLAVDGAACISTLNLRRARKPGQPYDKSPDHDREFEPSELEAFLKPYFKSVEMWGLYPTARHSFYERLKKSGLTRMLPQAWDPVPAFYRSMTVGDFRWERRSRLDDCIDVMAVCRG